MGENTYFIDPHDEQELARLQLQDNLFNEIIDLLPKQFVPQPNARVLDLACGPGGWPLQVAQAYPELAVVGVDVSPQMIKYARAQSEVREVEVQFGIMDLLKPWDDLPDNYCDLINARFIGGFVPVARLETLLRQCQRVLKPGGTLRITKSVFMSTPTSPTTHKLNTIVCAAMYKAGLIFSPHEISIHAKTACILKTIGFEESSFAPYVINLTYGSPMHRPMLENLVTSQKLLIPFLVKMKICTSEEIEKLLDEFQQEWEDPSFCGHWHICSLSTTRLE